MISSIQSYKGVRVERIWFTNIGVSRCDIIRFTRATTSIQDSLFVINNDYETVINNINLSDESILKKFSKTVRYEIKKCLKEEVKIKFLQAKDLLENNHFLKDFEKIYTGLAKSTNNKDLLKAYNKKKINSYIINDLILISQARLGTITIYHIYVWGDKNSVLLYSASNFREEKEFKYLGGQMNKLLHYKDMIYFRDKGVQYYDWGNISNSSNPNGIDKFKMSFGGTIERGYNIFVGNTIIGKCLILGKKLFHSIF